MNKWIIINKLTFVLSIIVILLFSQSCTDLSSDPNQNSNQSNSKIQISLPTSNGTLMEGNNKILYSITQPYTIKFLELYINGTFVKNIPPGSNGDAPFIYLQLDSTYIVKKLNLYIIYYDKDGTSQKSNTVSQVLVTKDSRIPFAPYNASLLKFNDGSINISWKDSSHYIEKYELWRKVNFEGAYLLHQELSGKSSNSNDYNLDTSNIYFYKVRGVKSSGYSDFSNEVNTAGIIIAGNIYPPTNLSANVSGISNVILNWKDNSDNENYFAVQRSFADEIFNRIAVLTKNTTSYKDSGNGLVAGAIYQYRIVAYSNEDSAISNTVSININSGLLLPPTDISATYDSTVRVINLNWNNSDHNILYFDIERKNDLTAYTLLRRIDASINLYLDFNVETNKVYTYRVRGYDLNRFSEYSNEVTISTF